MCLHLQTHILSTRKRANRVTHRRHECLRCGERFNTWEILETAARRVGVKRLQAAAKQVDAAITTRANRAERRARIEAHLRRGWKPVAIAHELGENVRYVERVRKGE